MSEAAKQALSVLRRVAEFLDELPDDQVADLAEGRARLTYIPWGASDPVKPVAMSRKRPSSAKAPVSTVDASVIGAELKAASSPEEGRSILRRLPKVDDLRAVAAEVGMPAPAKLSRDVLTERIVEFTVSSRLHAEGIRLL